MSDESKARSIDPAYSQLTLGIAPDSWGVWFPDDERQIAPLTTLDQMAQAGFEYLETGPFGYFPTDPNTLRRETLSRGLKVIAGTQPGVLHHREAWAATEEGLRANAEVLAALEARHLVFLPPSYIDYKTWEDTDARHLDDKQWGTYMEGLNHMGAMLLNDYGIRLELHSHGDTHIETRADIDRMMKDTDPEVVSFCLDTGHVVYGGEDPVSLITDYPDRIGYVHIKAMEPTILARAREKGWPFGEAVAHGVSVTPPAGEPEMHRLVGALAALNKDLYVVVEQDLYPVDPAFPLPNAIATRSYLAECNLGRL